MGVRGGGALAPRPSDRGARRRPHDELLLTGRPGPRDERVPGSRAGGRMKAERALANFDSSAAMLRALGRYLHGKDFPRVGNIPAALAPLGVILNLWFAKTSFGQQVIDPS